MKKQFIYDGYSVYEVYEVYVLNKNKFVYSYDIKNIQNDVIFFDEKIDALYTQFLKNIKEGTPLKNYKRSKYYKIYLERLKKDYPEYVI